MGYTTAVCVASFVVVALLAVYLLTCWLDPYLPTMLQKPECNIYQLIPQGQIVPVSSFVGSMATDKRYAQCLFPVAPGWVWNRCSNI